MNAADSGPQGRPAGIERYRQRYLRTTAASDDPSPPHRQGCSRPAPECRGGRAMEPPPMLETDVDGRTVTDGAVPGRPARARPAVATPSASRWRP